jgi:hypothetical protein
MISVYARKAELNDRRLCLLFPGLHCRRSRADTDAMAFLDPTNALNQTRAVYNMYKDHPLIKLVVKRLDENEVICPADRLACGLGE